MAMIRFLILLIIGLEIVDRQPKVAGLIIPEYTQFSFQLPSGDPKFCQLLRAPSVPFFPSQELFFQFCKNGYITLAGVGNFPLFRTLAEIESYFSQIETVIVAPGFIEDPLVSSQRARERRQAEDYFTQVLVQFTDIPSMEPFQNLLPGVTPTRGFFFKWTSFQFVEAGKRRKRRQVNPITNTPTGAGGGEGIRKFYLLFLITPTFQRKPIIILPAFPTWIVASTFSPDFL